MKNGMMIKVLSFNGAFLQQAYKSISECNWDVVGGGREEQ